MGHAVAGEVNCHTHTHTHQESELIIIVIIIFQYQNLHILSELRVDQQHYIANS